MLGLEYGQCLGGRQMTVSSDGSSPLQKAFLTSPCRRVRCLDTARATRSRSWFCVNTGAYLSVFS